MQMAVQRTTYEMPISEHAFDGTNPIVGLHRHWNGALCTNIARTRSAVRARIRHRGQLGQQLPHRIQDLDFQHTPDILAA
jgi:hypothetical protein